MLLYIYRHKYNVMKQNTNRFRTKHSYTKNWRVKGSVSGSATLKGKMIQITEQVSLVKRKDRAKKSLQVLSIALDLPIPFMLSFQWKITGSVLFFK